MTPEMLKAFREELESIEKLSGFMQNVGTNVGNTLKGFTTPVASIKKGWNLGGWSQGQEAVQMAKAKIPMTRFGNKWAKGQGAGRFLPGNKAITLATGAMMAPEAFKKEDPTGKGRSRSERVGRFAGTQLGGLIGTPYGLSGSIAGSVAGELGGKYIGKAVGALKGKKKPPAKSHDPAQAQPTKSSVSNR